MKKHILLTRAENQNEEVANYLQSNNCEVVIEPIFTVKNLDLDFEILKKLQNKKINGIIITSINAAQNAIAAISFLNLDKNLKIFVVGKKTGEVFIKQGYKNVFFPKESNALNLKNLILVNCKSAENLLYFCGEIINLDFAIELKQFGIMTQKIVSYKILNHQFFSQNFLEKITEINFDFVLLYSKNSAKIFFELCKKHNLEKYFSNSKFLCLSKEIMLFVQETGYKNSTTFAKNSILKNFYE